jgi:hypothetical protein
MMSNYLVPGSGADHYQLPHSSAVYLAQLLHQSDLSELIELDWVKQIEFFLTERAHLINQV